MTNTLIRTSRLGAAFTLIELLIVIALLSVLAAILVPLLGSATDMARVEAMASNVAHVRGVILTHAGTADVPLTPSGFPTTIKADWFRESKLPDHAWTGDPINVEIVNLAPNVVYPAVKTFDPTNAADKNGWYNSANGCFCVRVPAQPNAGATLQLFNDANKTGATALGQTAE